MTKSAAGLAKPDFTLLALDAEDLAVLSAHVQDMAIRQAEMIYLPAEKKFVLIGSRFDWIAADNGVRERVVSGIHFERVLGVRKRGFSGDAPHVLLSAFFEETAAPGGCVTLAFADGSAIRLDVECLEAQMRDLGPRTADPAAETAAAAAFHTP